jgi:hypothetical protein
MKQNRLIRLLAAGAVSAIALTTAFAQDSAISTNAITGAGTITAYTPGSNTISLRAKTSSQPVNYHYTSSTRFLDSAGKTVLPTTLKPDMLVKFTYVKERDGMVIRTITLTSR